MNNFFLRYSLFLALLMPFIATSQVADASFNASLLHTITEDIPVLNQPSIQDGKLKLSWNTQSESPLRLFELCIFEAQNNESLGKNKQKPIFAEVIKGYSFEESYKSLGLRNGGKYYYTIHETNAVVISTANNFSSNVIATNQMIFSIEDVPVCIEPKFFKIAQSTQSNAITVKWVGQPSDLEYVIRYNNQAVGNAYTFVTVPAVANKLDYQYTFTGLTASDKYDFLIKSKCAANGNIAYSSGTTATFQAQACQNFVSSVTSTTTQNSITINWNNNDFDGFEYFEVGIGECGKAKEYYIVQANTNGLNNTYLFNNLSNNKNYCIVVKGLCNCEINCSSSSLSVSNEKSISVLTQSPTTCANPIVSVLDATTCGVRLTWSYPEQSIIHIDGLSDITVNTPSNFEYTIANLPPQSYVIKVRKICIINGVQMLSNWIPLSATVPSPCPKPVVTFSPTTFSKLQVNFSSTYSYLNLCYKKTSSASWTNLDNISTGYTIENLEPGETYMFRAFSPYCGIVCGNLSSLCESMASSVFIENNLQMPCATPTVTPQNVLSTSISFVVVNYANNYTTNIRYRIKGTNTWTNNIPATSSPVTITGLTAGKEYEFEFIHPCSNLSNSTWASLSQLSPAADICTNPQKTDITVQTVTNNSIALSWVLFPANNTFDIRYKESTVATWQQVSGITTASQTFSSLASGKTYQFEIRRKVGNATCDWLILDPITTYTTTCEAIEISKITYKPTESTIEVSWIDGINPASFEIRYRRLLTTAWTVVVLNQQTKFTATSLPANTEYEFELKRICQYATADWFSIGIGKTTFNSVLPEPKCDPNVAPPAASAPTSLLSKLSVNQIVKMYGIPIKITYVENTGYDIFKGKGEAVISFSKKNLEVSFSNLKVNVDYVAVEGVMEGVKDDLNNYPSLTPTLITLSSFSCTDPKPKPGFDKNGLYQPGGTKTDPSGFDKDGKYAATPLYDCFASTDKIDTKYDPRGFDNKGIHFETKTKYDPNGCDVKGIKSDGKTPCICYKPCDPCADKPYYWLNGGSKTSILANAFANSKKTLLPSLIDPELLKINNAASAESTVRKNDCDIIRKDMDNYVNEKLNFDKQFIYGEKDKYYAEAMSKNFNSEPKVSFVNDNSNLRNQFVINLEAEHVKLYACDIKVVAYNDYLTILTELKTDPKKAALLESTIFEKMRRLSDKEVEDFKKDDAEFKKWINQQIEEYAKLEYRQKYGKDLAVQEIQGEDIPFHKSSAFPKLQNQKIFSNTTGTLVSNDNNDARLFQQAQTVSINDINFEYEQGFQTIAGTDRAFYLEALAKERALFELPTAINPSKLPIELTKKIGTTDYSIYLDNLKITPTGGTLDAYLLITIPNGTAVPDKILLKGTDIKFGAGGLSSGNGIKPRLYLQTDIALGLNDVARFVLKGSTNKTYAEWDCEGFKQMSVEADVQFCRKHFTPLDDKLIPITDPAKLVTANFTATMPEWGNFEATLKVTNFAITKYPDYKFVIKDVILDYSQTLPHNPKIKFPTNYSAVNVAQSIASPEWRGFSLGEISVTLPPSFDSKATGSISVFVQTMIIDNEGLTGVIGVKAGKALLGIDDGNLNGWAYSIDKFEVKVFQSEITGGAFGGHINVPILSGKTKTTKTARVTYDDCFRYEAIISPGTGEYIITVEPGADREFKVDMLKAKVTLGEDSKIIVGVVDGKFVATATLNAKVVFTGEYSKNPKNNMEAMNDVSFTGLSVSNKAPYFSPGNWKLPTSYGINYHGFGLTFSKIAFADGLADDKTTLNFDINLNLTSPKPPVVPAPAGTTPPVATTPANVTTTADKDKEKDPFFLSATGGFRINGKMEFDDLGRQRWVYDNFQVTKILVDGSFPGVKKIHGYAEFFDEATPGLNPVFGTGVQGGLDVSFDGIGVEVKAVALFGHTKTAAAVEYKYFMVDAMAYFDKPVVNVGGLNLVGFGGGCYYHMTRDESKFFGLTLTKDVAIPTTIGTSLTGISYLPTEVKILGLRAMVAMELPKSAETALNCNVMFGIEFNEKFGINEISFLGNATFMDKLKVGKNPKGVLGADPTPSSSGIRASLEIVLKFPQPGKDPSLHASMTVYGNIQDVVKGGGVGDRMGSAILHIDPKTWYLNIGTPNEQERISLLVGIKGLGNLAKLNAYMCIGNKVPPFPDLPSSIKAATGMGNFMANESARSSGKGFAFGANLNIDLGEKEFMIFYGTFRAEIGFDVMLKKYEGITCTNNDNKPIGMNGWYASGQFYAGVNADIGIKAKIWGKESKFPIMRMNAAVVMQAKLPNPFYAKGVVGGSYSILGGILKGQCKFEVTMGESCAIAGAGGPDPNAAQALIVDTDPAEADEDKVPVSSALTVNFSVPLDVTFADTDINNQSHTYLLKYDYIKLKNHDYELLGTLDKATATSVVFTPVTFMPEYKNLTFEVKATLYKDGAVLKTEEKNIRFTTGKGLRIIPADNIVAAYPANGQFNFYRKEYKEEEGYLLLNRSQADLFDDANAEYKAFVKKQDGTCFATKIKYDESKNLVRFDLPAGDEGLQTDQIYNLQLATFKAATGPLDNNINNGTANKIAASEGCPANVNDWKVLYSSYFRTSEHDFFLDKVQESFDNATVSAPNTWSPITINKKDNTEPFDKGELIGDGKNPALSKISFRLQSTNWYNNPAIALMYQTFPRTMESTSIGFNRDGSAVFDGAEIQQLTGDLLQIKESDFKDIVLAFR